MDGVKVHVFRATTERGRGRWYMLIYTKRGVRGLSRLTITYPYRVWREKRKGVNA